MRGMRGYALATAALAGFFAGMALEVSGAAFAGMDLVVALLFAVGAAVGFYAYARGASRFLRRVAVVGAGLDVAALIFLLATAL